jgi:hypothetical protein
VSSRSAHRFYISMRLFIPTLTLTSRGAKGGMVISNTYSGAKGIPHIHSGANISRTAVQKKLPTVMAVQIFLTVTAVQKYHFHIWIRTYLSGPPP